MDMIHTDTGTHKDLVLTRNNGQNLDDNEHHEIITSNYNGILSKPEEQM